MNVSHGEFLALAPAYVLDALEPDERRVFEAHLRGCQECAAEVRSLLAAVDALARSVPQRTPPEDLRARVLASVRGARIPVVEIEQRSARTNWWAGPRAWLPVSAVALIALGAGIYGSHLHVEARLAALSSQAESNDREIAAARRAALDAHAAMSVLAAPDVISIALKGEGVAASATARALWSRQHGLIVAGTNMPAPPSGKCYQVWMISARGAVSAGVLPEPGAGLAVFRTPPDMTPPLSIAVTVEPVNGGVTPSDATILAGTAQASF